MSIQYNEQWRDVVGFEGFYQVSDLGRVRSARKTNRSFVGQILRSGLDPKGYEKVVLCRSGKMKTAEIGTGRTNVQKIVSGQTWRSVENV